MSLFASINKNIETENKHMDAKVGGGWDELGNWEIEYIYVLLILGIK